MAFKLRELEPRYYTYIGVACAAIGLVMVLLAIITILGLILREFELAWAYFTAGAMLSMLAATLAFNKIGGKKIPT